MTLQTETNQWSYSANGVTVSFDYERKILNESDLTVVLLASDGTEDVQTLNVDYTITGVAANSGGTVEFISAPASGNTVLIYCDADYTQPFNFRDLGRFSATFHQDAFDWLGGLIQQLNDRLKRTLRFSVKDDVLSEVRLEDALSRYPYINAAGQLTFVTGDPTQPLTHIVVLYKPTAGQTLIPVEAGYTPGSYNLSVYRDGIKLIVGDEYTETTSSTITLTTPAAGTETIELNIGDVYDVTASRSSRQQETIPSGTGTTINLTTMTYTPGAGEIDVFFNGSRLDDYTETNSTTITLPFSRISSDVVTVIAGRIMDAGTVDDGAVTTVKLADAAVTAAKLANTLDLSAKTVTLPDTSVGAVKLANTLDLSAKTVTLPDASVTNAKLSLSANASAIKTAINASGDAPIYGCRAWCVFNGTGTPAISASGNIASITDLGTGLYQFTFTTPMPDANFAVIPGGNGTSDTPGSGGRQFISVRTRTSSSVILEFLNDGGAVADLSYASFAVFR